MGLAVAQSETVERILDAAEQLFAEKGFAETSLRLITSKAGVNLAAVNYHFGSKKSLIQAVFTRFLNPFVVSLEQELDNHEQAGNPEQSLEELLEMLVKLVLALTPRSGNDLSTFMRLLGLAFSQSQGHLRKYLGEVYGKVFKRYMALVLRSVAFTLSSMKALKAMGEVEYGQRASTDDILRQMVPFFAAGVRADLLVTEAEAVSV